MKMTVNGAVREVNAPPDMPLLWVLRDLLGLTGTKFGAGDAAGALAWPVNAATVSLMRKFEPIKAPVRAAG